MIGCVQVIRVQAVLVLDLLGLLYIILFSACVLVVVTLLVVVAQVMVAQVVLVLDLLILFYI